MPADIDALIESKGVAEAAKKIERLGYESKVKEPFCITLVKGSSIIDLYVHPTLGGDLLDPEGVRRALDGCEIVWHLAANPEVRISSLDPEFCYRQNIEATHNLLEAVRKGGGG